MCQYYFYTPFLFSYFLRIIRVIQAKLYLCTITLSQIVVVTLRPFPGLLGVGEFHLKTGWEIRHYACRGIPWMLIGPKGRLMPSGQLAAAVAPKPFYAIAGCGRASPRNSKKEANMTRFILVIIAFLLSSTAFAFTDEDIVGTWKLASAVKKDVNTGTVTDAYGGKNAVGFLSYSKGHRMMAMASFDNRIKPDRVDHLTPEQKAQLFETYFAYAGTYTLSGNTIQHHIETSWNETWTGTTVTRDIALEGEKLVITTPPQLRFDGKTYIISLVWEKIE